ncbi:hypothetical protein [Paraburkholderia sp. D1E]|uniref:hypothetical protein n=1 Tax=Paraburkholderia sp. D1E TaxID=3461398 RepID=UPI0040458B5D
MSYLALFFSGAFLCNCVPHLASGLRGEPFPTPFAKPHGVGNSSALVNVLWGYSNLLAGLYLLTRQPVTIGVNANCLTVLAGVLVLGTFSAVHFGKVWQSKHTR